MLKFLTIAIFATKPLTILRNIDLSISRSFMGTVSGSVGEVKDFHLYYNAKRKPRELLELSGDSLYRDETQHQSLESL